MSKHKRVNGKENSSIKQTCGREQKTKKCETRAQIEYIFSQHSICLYCPLFPGNGQLGWLQPKKPQLPLRWAGCLTILGVGIVAVI